MLSPTHSRRPFFEDEFIVNTYVRGVVFIQSSVVIVARRFTLEPSLK